VLPNDVVTVFFLSHWYQGDFFSYMAGTDIRYPLKNAILVAYLY